MYRCTVAGTPVLGDLERHAVYFTGIDDGGLPVCSLHKSNAYIFNMRKDAIFIANALNGYYNVDAFNIKLFKLEEI